MHEPISAPTHSKHASKLAKFNYQSQPTALSLEDLLESKFTIKSFEVSPRGRTGVFMVETDKGSIVIKSSNDGPIDEFLNQFARLLTLKVPKSECYLCSDPIFHKIMFEIQKFCSKDECQYELIKTRLDFPFYQVLEYIPSISMAQIGKIRFQMHQLHPQRLYSLGMVIGFDMIINNSDRFKLAWRSEGNINNVLIHVPEHRMYRQKDIHDRNNTEVLLGDYYFIDHSGVFLDLDLPQAAKNFNTYMERVCELHVQIIRSLSEERPMPPEFQKLVKQFEFYCHYTFTDFDLRKIAIGIIYLTNKFLEVYQTGHIKELYESMLIDMLEGKTRSEKEADYWAQYWNKQMEKVRMRYIDQVYVKLQAIYTTYPQTLDRIIKEMGDFEEVRLEAEPTTEKPEPVRELSESAGSSSKQEASSQPSHHSIKPYEDGNHLRLGESSVDSQMPVKPQRREEEESEGEPQRPERERRWRQKLAKFREENGPQPGKNR